MDAPVPQEPLPMSTGAPETEPVASMEDATFSHESESVPAETEGPVPAPATAGARKVSRPNQPPQKGTTLFPIARVSKIIKADSSVDICSKEATFLISAATELFVKKFAEEGCTNARLDKRKMVRYDDMAKAVAQNEYLDFLREIVPTTIPLPEALKRREERMQADVGQVDNVPENELEEEDAVDESMMEEPEADTSEWQALDENATGESETLGASNLSEKTEVLEAEEAWGAPSADS